MDPGTIPFSAIGVISNAVSGSIATVTWPGRQFNKSYEWYLTATVGLNTYTGPTWRFVTPPGNTAPVASNLAFNLSRDAFTNQTLIAKDANGDDLLFQTNSLPAHGLLTNFNPVTGVFNYRPAHGYSGQDGFTFHASDSQTNSTIATVTVTVFPPQDTNANGIPDAWEVAYNLPNASADIDGDGMTAFQEYFANTNPTNAASAFRFIGATNDPGGRTTFAWTSVGGTRYRIQYNNGALNGGFTDIIRPANAEIDPAPNGMASTQTFIDDFTQTGGPPTNHARYYRIKIVQ
jgi:hypothetical protein